MEKNVHLVGWNYKSVCDVDYKSKLSVGKFPDISISDLWNSNIYNNYRNFHLNKKRPMLSPCSSCSVVKQCAKNILVNIQGIEYRFIRIY